MWECISEAAEDLSFSFSSILGWPTGFWPFKLTSSYFQNRQWYFKVDYSILSTAADGPAPFWAPPTVHQSSTLPLPLHPLWEWQITVSVITTNCFIFNHSREIYFHIECGWEVGKEKFSALVWLHEGFGCIQLFPPCVGLTRQRLGGTGSLRQSTCFHSPGMIRDWRNTSTNSTTSPQLVTAH